MNLTTRVHTCLAEGRPAFGGWCMLNSPQATELLAGMVDFDFVGIDRQHAPIGVADACHHIRAMQAASPQTTPFLRIPTHDKYGIEQALDAGYTGLIVPLVESADQARALARAAYYPPKGARSLAGTTRGCLYENYAEQINDHVILLPQTESREGLEHCEEIVNVPGVSGLLIGPGDLSLSCGWSGKDSWNHKPFTDAVSRVVSACKEAGKVSAIIICGLEAASNALDAGINLIAFASDGIDLRVTTLPLARQSLATLRARSE